MSDMLGSALSGLNTYQRALATTSHNIANANTDGYSRQTVTMNTRNPQQLGPLTLGSGVQLSSVQRAYDQYAVVQQRSTTASFAQQDTLHSLSGRIDTLLSDSDQGLSPAMSKFYDSIQAASTDPSSLAARRELLATSSTLTARFQGIDAELSSINDETNARISASVTEINGLSKRIADLNLSISRTVGQGGKPNDLLDQRDTAVLELNQIVRVSTLEQKDGTMSLFVGNGQPLVLGTQQNTLALTGNRFDPTRAEVSFSGQGEITSALEGGSLGGILAFRDDVLTPTRNQLGLLANQLASAFNDQHAQGTDLRGDVGGDLFSIAAIEPQASSANTGTAALSVTATNTFALTGDAYVLSQTDTGWQLRNTTNKQVVSLSGDGSAANPLSADGFSMVVTGSAARNDEFLIAPTGLSAKTVAVAITDPAKIAAAANDANAGPGDNRNMLAMAGLENKKVLVNGTATLSDGVQSMLGKVAATTRSSQVGAAAQQTLLTQATARRDDVSGVNLDEEAANILRFQQAYQASAQVASVANSLFQTIINAFN
ncbi:flagellar hook-associated protein 1 FlgK [Paraperlucidibaca baekdonensis]|uniref:Flagellar hook-associated protein 1 n=1 Tax=Paraperlucidibaca baekdonensis TaxID=748120 RepID=A0A3E0H2K2_9GAMM|nr:flagellar hook-associated protein FlgK [Paraperlucidibaca baekdonensis]REH36748.1 flagellar hook-associated protein 1 FlgK [Paraperlucidibaca baekdonensis]